MKRKLYLLSLRVLGKNFDKQCNEISKINDEEGFFDIVRRFLARLLQHAYSNVPYYYQVCKDRGLLELNNTDFPELERIPVLTKQIIRTNHAKLISRDLKKRRWWYNSSGGSTGEPVRFIQDEEHERWSNATVKYYYENILGIEETFAKKTFLWGSERDLFEGTIGFRAKINNWLTNTIFLNSFRMTEEDMTNYIVTIDRYKPELIKGYAGSLFEISKYIEKHKLSVYSPKIISSHSEILTNEMRQKIENVFGAKVYDFYGSREVGPIAGECKEGQMHIFGFNNCVELLDTKDLPVKVGHGKVILTTLHNYSMPLVRYEIGDTAIVGSKGCKCGNPLPTLTEVTGRMTDHFIKEDGTIIYGDYFTHLFYLKDWIKAFQIIQEDYRKIRILAVLQGDIDDAEKREIEGKMKLVMGKNCNIIWEFVEEIPPTQSGKHLYTKSLLYCT